MSPCVTLPQEVMILGAILGDADRVVSTVAEDTVTSGYPSIPLPLGMSKDGDPTTNGHSSLAQPWQGWVGPSCLGWWGLRMIPQVVRKAGSTYLRAMVSRVTLSLGRSYTPWVFPPWDNLWAKAPGYKMIAQMEKESQVVGPKA